MSTDIGDIGDNASALRPEVTLGTDRRLAEEPNWALFSSTTLHAMATTDNIPAIGHDLARTWTDLGNRISELSHRLLAAQGRMVDAWAGQDTQLAARAVVSTARFAIDTGRAAQLMGVRIGDEAHAAEAAKRLMPPPQEFDANAELARTLTQDSAPADVGAAAERARGTKEAQIRVMASFHGSSVEVDDATPVFSEPVPVTAAGGGRRAGAGVAPTGWTAPHRPFDGSAALSGIPGTAGGGIPPGGPASGTPSPGDPAWGGPGRHTEPNNLLPITTTPTGFAPAAMPAALPGSRADSWGAGTGGGAGTAWPGNTGSGSASPVYSGGPGFPSPGYSATGPGNRGGGSAFGSAPAAGRTGSGPRGRSGSEGGWNGGPGAPGPVGGASATGAPATGAETSRGATSGGTQGMGGAGGGAGGVREHRRPGCLIEDGDVWAVNLPYTDPVIR